MLRRQFAANRNGGAVPLRLFRFESATWIYWCPMKLPRGQHAYLTSYIGLWCSIDALGIGVPEEKNSAWRQRLCQFRQTVDFKSRLGMSGNRSSRPLFAETAVNPDV